MTDDETKALAAYLRPRPHWIGWIGGIATAAGLVVGMITYLSRLATRDELQRTRDDVVQVRLDQAVMKGDIAGAARDTAEIKSNLSDLVKSLERKHR